MPNQWLVTLGAVIPLLLSLPAHASPAAAKALCDAAERGTPAQIAKAIAKGARVNAICPVWGETPLEIASLQGKDKSVEALLSAGAAVNQIDSRQDAALMLSHSAVITRALLAHGADLNQRDKDGQDAMISAGIAAGKIPEQDCIDIVQMLLDKGADINAKDNDGLTVLTNAIRSKQNRFIEFLIAHGADVNARITSGNTPLDIVINSMTLPTGEDPADYQATKDILLAHGAVQ